MLENNYGYVFSYPIRLSDHEAPIGVFKSFVSLSEFNILTDDEIKEFERINYAAAKRIELLFNLQYNRLILD